jgi:hypothetical protein
MDGINISKQASVSDFLKNAAQVLRSDGDATQRTFGGSVVLFGFTRSTFILGIIA